VRRGDALRVIEGLPRAAYDVAFADPPYDHGWAALVAARWIAEPFATILGLEHGVEETLPAGGDTRRYGSTALTFYRTKENDALNPSGRDAAS